MYAGGHRRPRARRAMRRAQRRVLLGVDVDRAVAVGAGDRQASQHRVELRRLISREPATSAATFCSSTTFQSMNSSMSGWSRSRLTILAARRVVPPDLIAPAARSPIFRKDIRPEDLPPPESGSLSPRSVGEVGAGAGAVLEDARLAGPEVHDAALVDEVVARRTG